ncbi:MAG TPA: DUF4349 domain-containing protein [Candidatus Angelobacter sp.]|jgi:hypothetical protein
MSKSNHPIEQEELMAYLDGELETNRAIAAAAHLEHCAECQELAADLRKLSQEMMGWELEELEPEDGMPIAIQAALQDRPGKPRNNKKQLGWKILLTRQGLAWAGGGAVAVLFLMIFSFSPLRPVPMARFSRQEAKLEDYYTPKPVRPLPPQPEPTLHSGLLGLRGRASTAKLQAEDEQESGDRPGVPGVPMIARTAALTLTTKEFDKTRASLEDILKRHGGYMGELKVSAPADAGRTLTATLRIPAQQLDAAMSELKKLGRIEDESQGGEEVTQQYVDLQARLANGIHTEQRLTEILRSRTGKLQDVLKVELEIDRVRGEIEQMQAEKKELSKRVAFATLNATVREEYFARLQGTPPSTGSRFRNAAVDGYNTVVEGLIDIGLFLLSAGPSLLLWAAILFFPVRWAWRKVKAARKLGETVE